MTRPQHARQRMSGPHGRRLRRFALPVSAASVLALAIAAFTLNGAAGGVPRALYSTPTTPPNTNSGLPSLPPGAGPAWLKNAGQVAAAKSATTINQTVQIGYVPNLKTDIPGGPHGRPLSYSQFYVFPVSPPGSSAPFGILDPVQVKTLAFGSIPTTLTLNARTHVDQDGKPTWVYLEMKSYSPDGSTEVSYEDPIGHGSLDISISDVTVDGVPVNVGDCHTSAPATFDMHAKLYKYLFQRPPDTTGTEEPSFTPFAGGQLLGNLTIPSFTGCVGNGEDFSPLFTAFVSGNQNLLRLTTTGPGGYTSCIDPNNVSPFCGTLPPIPLPTNTQVH